MPCPLSAMAVRRRSVMKEGMTGVFIQRKRKNEGLEEGWQTVSVPVEVLNDEADLRTRVETLGGAVVRDGLVNAMRGR